MHLRRSPVPVLKLAVALVLAAAAGSPLRAQGTPVSGGCTGGALGPAHDQPGVICEDFDTDRNGSGSIEWSRLPLGPHPCDPLAARFDPADDVLGYSIDGGPVPLGTNGQQCSEDAPFGGAQGTCFVVPEENDWHLHSAYEGCDTDDSYDQGSSIFDSSCALGGEWAHSGVRSLHLGRHLGPPGYYPDFDTYRFRQTSAFVLDPVHLSSTSMLEFWQIIQVCDDTCVAASDGETTAGGQLQASLRDPNTGLFSPWRRLDIVENGYDATAQAAFVLCEFDPGDDRLSPGDETLCLDDSPQWADMGDIHGTDVSCTVDTDLNDPANLDCGETTNRTVDPNCSWVADPGCGSFLESGSVGQGVWARTRADLSAFGGREARLRWIFQGGGGWGFGESRSFLEPETEPVYMAELDDGWYVDDIRISGVVEPESTCPDADVDGFPATEDPACFCVTQVDCDDTDPSRYPGATEICDGKDNDCDQVVPPDEIDADGDGLAPCEGDCDDSSASVYPGAPEICDQLDNNCDTVYLPMEIDKDGDGVAPCQGDCDDLDAGSFATPPPIAGLEAAPDPGGALLTWDDLAPLAGTATVYDVFSGLVSDFQKPQGYRAGDCVGEDLASPSVVVGGDDPPPGDARYYVMRGQNTCPAGTGTWGDAFRDEEINGSPRGCD